MVPTGPVKGAIALSNMLVSLGEVTLVSIKAGPGASADIDPRVKQICLNKNGTNVVQKFFVYKSLLVASGTRENNLSISYCFSADMLNSFCRKYSTICSSVRGNLITTYPKDFGFWGHFIARFHLKMLFRYDYVLSMSLPMAKQIKSYSGKHSHTIANFIDEIPLKKFKKCTKQKSQNKAKLKKFIFVGKLDERKKPMLLLQTFYKMRCEGYDASLQIVGDGSQKQSLCDFVDEFSLKEVVKIHGHVDNPYKIVSQSDIFVLPSVSEGTPRASLEALFIGLPCVMRDIDGNTDLIEEGINGILFKKDSDLYCAMIAALDIRINSFGVTGLLPKSHSQKYISEQYKKILDL